MASDLEKAVILNPDLQRQHFGLYPQMDASRTLVSRLAKRSLPKVRQHPTSINMAPGRDDLFRRLVGQEQWVGMSTASVPGPRISTYGNGSQRLVAPGLLEKEVALATLTRTSAEELKLNYARRFMTTLAEASLVRHGLQAAGVRLSAHGNGMVSDGELTDNFEAWLAHDPESIAAYDDSRPLWEQPFVTVTQLPSTSE